jgi:hypothetical protein
VKIAIRKGFLKRILLGLGIAGLAAGLCAADAFLIEPNFPRVIRQEISVRGLPESLDGLKIVQLTDLHQRIADGLDVERARPGTQSGLPRLRRLGVDGGWPRCRGLRGRPR